MEGFNEKLRDGEWRIINMGRGASITTKGRINKLSKMEKWSLKAEEIPPMIDMRSSVQSQAMVLVMSFTLLLSPVFLDRCNVKKWKMSSVQGKRFHLYIPLPYIPSEIRNAYIAERCFYAVLSRSWALSISQMLRHIKCFVKRVNRKKLSIYVGVVGEVGLE